MGLTPQKYTANWGVMPAAFLAAKKPADLPIIQATKFELVINLKAAKAINFEIPPLIRALAGEVIE
jgi:putative ABC transport system substrate-binding protein